jgi:tungstate transport system permease protein
MNDFAAAFQKAFSLIGSFDPELRQIVFLSLEVSLTASACAFVIGAPLGTALAVYSFRGRSALIVIVNALLGLPPVVVGLVVYLLLSRSGPLRAFGILFTPTAMIIAQCALATPIVIALVHRVATGDWRAYGDALLVDGASRLRTIGPLMSIGREGLLTAFLAASNRGGRRHYHRRGEHQGLYPHHDDGDCSGNEQRGFQFSVGTRINSNCALNDGKRYQSLCRSRSHPSLMRFRHEAKRKVVLR